MTTTLLCFKCATSLCIPYASAIGGSLDGRVCDLCEGRKMGSDSHVREYKPTPALLVARIRRLESIIESTSTALTKALQL